MTTWMLCMVALLKIAAAPLAIPSCYDRNYPLPLHIAIGIGLVMLSWTFPSPPHWMLEIRGRATADRPRSSE